MREETELQHRHDILGNPEPPETVGTPTGAFVGADTAYEIDARKNDPEEIGESSHVGFGADGLDEVPRERV